MLRRLRSLASTKEVVGQQCPSKLEHVAHDNFCDLWSGLSFLETRVFNPLTCDGVLQPSHPLQSPDPTGLVQWVGPEMEQHNAMVSPPPLHPVHVGPCAVDWKTCTSPKELITRNEAWTIIPSCSSPDASKKIMKDNIMNK